MFVSKAGIMLKQAEEGRIELQTMLREAITTTTMIKQKIDVAGLSRDLHKKLVKSDHFKGTTTTTTSTTNNNTTSTSTTTNTTSTNTTTNTTNTTTITTNTTNTTTTTSTTTTSTTTTSSTTTSTTTYDNDNELSVP
jgi:acetyl/propionyl-CoA carboxylase alpha subunit